MKRRTLALIAGWSYVVIFFAAIFANFFALESLIQNPLEMVEQKHMLVRFGTIAFLLTVVFDVIVAWALNELFQKHPLTILCTFFRMMHAAIMGVAIFALPLAVSSTSKQEILHHVEIFNIIWLIGLFFFGIHLILLAKILGKPKWIAIMLTLAGGMYMVDTSAHFLMPNYDNYTDVFLALVAIPSIFGEMSFAIWLLVKGGKKEV